MFNNIPRVIKASEGRSIGDMVANLDKMMNAPLTDETREEIGTALAKEEDRCRLAVEENGHRSFRDREAEVSAARCADQDGDPLCGRCARLTS